MLFNSLKNMGIDNAFRIQAFQKYWAVILLSSSSQWIQQIVIGWLVYDLTGSSILTTLSIGIGLVPNFLAGPFGGVLADSWNKGRILSTMYAFKGILTIISAILITLGITNTWYLLCFVILMGLFQAICWPARLSIVPMIVPKKYLFNAFALSMVTSSSTRLIVPAIFGILLAIIGPGNTLLFGGAMYLVSCAIVSSINIPQQRSNIAKPSLRYFIDGINYVRNEPVLMSVVLMSAITYLLIVPSTHGLMPVYASEIFKVGPAGLGLMMSSLGLGATLGTLSLAAFPELPHKGRLMLVCLTVMLLSSMIFPHVPNLYIAIPFLVILNGGFDTFNAIRSATIQVTADDYFRGRAASINQMGTSLIGPGSLLIGGIAELLGAPSATTFSVLVMSLCLVSITLKYRQIWHLTYFSKSI